MISGSTVAGAPPVSDLPSLSVSIATMAPAADKAGSAQVRKTKMNLNSITMALYVLRSSPVAALSTVAAIMSVSSRTEIKSLAQSTAAEDEEKDVRPLDATPPVHQKVAAPRGSVSSAPLISFEMQCLYMMQVCGQPSLLLSGVCTPLRDVASSG